MAGRGGVDKRKWNGFILPECRPNPSILRLNAQFKWELARDPLHADIDVGKTCGVGPGMAFANGIKANESRIGVVGLVPCAVGGTKISKWAQGTRLYNQLVSRANESVRYGGRIRAILWYQGESDTVWRKDAEAYKGKMEGLIGSLRRDLNIPNIPVIQVGKFIEFYLLGILGFMKRRPAVLFTGGACFRRRKIHRAGEKRSASNQAAECGIR